MELREKIAKIIEGEQDPRERGDGRNYDIADEILALLPQWIRVEGRTPEDRATQSASLQRI